MAFILLQAALREVVEATSDKGSAVAVFEFWAEAISAAGCHHTHLLVVSCLETQSHYALGTEIVGKVSCHESRCKLELLLNLLSRVRSYCFRSCGPVEGELMRKSMRCPNQKAQQACIGLS